MEQGNMPDGLATVLFNGRGGIGDESRCYFRFLAAVTFLILFTVSPLIFLIIIIYHILSIF
jgi:hypothetical protein